MSNWSLFVLFCRKRTHRKQETSTQREQTGKQEKNAGLSSSVDESWSPHKVLGMNSKSSSRGSSRGSRVVGEEVMKGEQLSRAERLHQSTGVAHLSLRGFPR